MKLFNLIFFCVYACLSYGQTKSSFEADKKKIANDQLIEGIQEQDSLKIALGYYQLGKYESGIGNFLLAKAWFSKSLLIYKQKCLNFELGKNYQTLANNELRRKNMNGALAYADSALVIFKKINSSKGIISNYMFITNFSHEYLKKTPTSVLKDFDRMIAFVIKNDIKEELGYLYQLKADILTEINPKAAIESFSKSIYWLNKYGNNTNINSTNVRIALCYAKIGEPQKAKRIMGDGIYYKQNSNEEQFYFYKLSRFKTEIEIFKAEKNWGKAYETQEKYTNLQNELNIKEQSKLLSRQNSLDINALGLSHEKELMFQTEILRANQKKQYLFYLVGFILSIFMGTFFYQNAKNKKLAQQYLQISEKNKLLIKEQSHRVKNNLQVISSLIGLQINRLQNQELKESLEEMQGRIAVMSVLQQMFYGTNNSVEINVKEYFTQIIDKNEIIFNKHITKSLLIDNIQIDPNLAIHLGVILNELLTNSFKYAFGFDNSAPKIQIVFSIKAAEITFEYQDNGGNQDLLVFEKEYYATSQSFGLSLIKLKSDELSGEYSFAYENGLKFILKFPYHETKSINS
jgi:two-component sensor histidine kinase